MAKSTSKPATKAGGKPMKPAYSGGKKPMPNMPKKGAGKGK